MRQPGKNKPPATLSVIIIAKNEAHDIGDCIRSVKGLAHEVIVFDSGSTDGTQQICRDLGAAVFETTDWPGFGPQKNRALAKAAGDWVLSLDADERAGGELKTEIEKILRDGSDHDGFQIPRKNSFCGRFMKHSGWWPDYNVRLIKRGRGRFSDSLVHEKIEVAGSVGTLGGHIVHLSVSSVEESLEKLNIYSTAGAVILKNRGKKSGLLKAFAHSLWTFFRGYIIKRGFLDGRRGLLLAKLNADGTFYKYAKLAIRKELEKDVSSPIEASSQPFFLKDSGVAPAFPLFLRQQRFDVVFKYLYIKNQLLYGNKTDFYKNLYIEHIRAFNGFFDRDPDYSQPKQSSSDFLAAFEQLYQDLAQNGFDKNKSVIPVGIGDNITNGGHRLAAAAALNLDVHYLRHNTPCSSANWDVFLSRGLKPEYADYAALQYVILNSSARIVNLQPVTDPAQDAKVEEILNRHGFIFYKKDVNLTYNGYVNLKKLYYGIDHWHHESWIGALDNNFASAQQHVLCCAGPHPLRVFVFVCPSMEHIIQAKREIRNLYNVGNYSVHINDTHAEAIQLAQAYFNKNSLHINNTRPFNVNTRALDELVDEIKQRADAAGIDLATICVTGSAPMALLGLRDFSDLDFLYCGNTPFSGDGKFISNHDSQLQYYTIPKTEIILNPEYHFYYRGLKFITPGILLQMKRKRAEQPKDNQDCILLENYLKAPLLPQPPATQPAGFKLFAKTRNGRQRTIIIMGLKFTYTKKYKKRR